MLLLKDNVVKSTSLVFEYKTIPDVVENSAIRLIATIIPNLFKQILRNQGT